MENAQELENEIKYFELLNGGLTALKNFFDGKKFLTRNYLLQTELLKKERINFDVDDFYLPFLQAIYFLLHQY